MAPIRVLLVDDATEMRTLVAMSLRLNGAFDVVAEAGNGRDAIDLAAAERPDVVLLDLSMPEMDGLEALPRILEAAPDTAVVVFSAFDELHLSTKARHLGAADYVEKGSSLDEVARRLTRAYEERRPPRP